MAQPTFSRNHGSGDESGPAPPTSTNTGSLSARLRVTGLAAKLLAPFCLWRAAEGLFSKVFVVSIKMSKHNLKTFDNEVGRSS